MDGSTVYTMIKTCMFLTVLTLLLYTQPKSNQNLNKDFVLCTFRIVYVKFTETRARTDGDMADCVGDLKLKSSCPFVRFDFRKVEGIDLLDADCS